MSITFTTLAVPPFWEKQTILLVKSLRVFGGDLSDCPVVVLTLQGRPLPEESEEKLRALGVELAEFEMDEEARKFPLAVVPYGAAAAEKEVKTGIMAWMLPDSVILNPPYDFELAAGKKLGCRPVHHQNVGSTFSEPPDDFWSQIYAHCEVPEERIYRMVTCYREVIRPYFNAGLLVSRAEEGLMQNWLEVFQSTYQHPDFVPFYEQQKYAIFMHQAVLTGVILNRYTQDEIAELPEMYNYPLHMHDGYPDAGRIYQMEDLVSARFENTKVLSEFLNALDITDKQSRWLEGILTEFGER